MAHYLIVGGSSGIGAALGSRLKLQGHTIHITGRDAGRTCAAADAMEAGYTLADAREPEFADKVRVAAGEKLDGFAYCAGTINLKPLQRLADIDFMDDFHVNALGAAKAVQAVQPALKAAQGTASIVLFSSVAVAQGFANHASISMAKGAVEGLTRALSAEFAPKIRVNCIAPSLTETGLAKPLTSNAAIAQGIAALHAVPRLGQPDDIAAMAALLLSPESGWITGQVIAVDGGRSRVRTKG